MIDVPDSYRQPLLDIPGPTAQELFTRIMQTKHNVESRNPELVANAVLLKPRSLWTLKADRDLLVYFSLPSGDGTQPPFMGMQVITVVDDKFDATAVVLGAEPRA